MSKLDVECSNAKELSMAHELLGDVLRTPDEGGRVRRRYLLPVSIAIHAAAAAAVLIIPLAAEVDAPDPARTACPYMRAVALPPPPPPISVGSAPRSSGVSVPVQAPDAIAPEDESPADVSAASPGPPAMGTIGAPGGVDFGALVPTPNLTVVPPPAPPREPVPVGGKIREPRKILDVAPLYPPFAVAARKEGVVILEAVIDERGNVARVRVLRSEPLLDAAAVSAVERWRYTPTLLNNVPVPVLMTITVRFSLR
jgi:protein TonB